MGCSSPTPLSNMYVCACSVQFSHSVVSDSHVTPFAARQASLSITNSRSLLKLMSITSVMTSNNRILCQPLLLLPSILPASGSFPMSQFFASGGQSIGVSASVLPMKDFRMDWLDLLAVQGTLRVFSNTTVQKHQFYGAQLTL